MQFQGIEMQKSTIIQPVLNIDPSRVTLPRPQPDRNLTQAAWAKPNIKTGFLA